MKLGVKGLSWWRETLLSQRAWGKALPRLAMLQAREGAGEQRRSGEREKDNGQRAANTRIAGRWQLAANKKEGRSGDGESSRLGDSSTRSGAKIWRADGEL